MKNMYVESHERLTQVTKINYLDDLTKTSIGLRNVNAVEIEENQY